MLKELKASLIAAAWFVFLTFPIMVIKVNTVHSTISWRWENMLYVAVGAFFGSLLWRWLDRKKSNVSTNSLTERMRVNFYKLFIENKKALYTLGGLGFVLLLFFPQLLDSYQINILTTAMIYIVLGLGLNIVVGLAGLLDLGYVAFYAVGAYTYALLNFHFGINFWVALPIGGAMGMLFGLILGFPILRLRGDYLAIVTLGFGAIIRIVLENWGEFSFGPSGISGIDRPAFFGLDLNLTQSTVALYYILLIFAIITVFCVNRLQDSRIGRAWVAMREDEIACQAMGIDKTTAKLTAFALGATWAGFMGVVFAAKTTFINPASFTFLETAMILAIVVLGGMGSILGVILAAIILILLPEYLRAFSELRMLIFGGAMVLMMVFRPQGLINSTRRKYIFKKKGEEN
jgi:branched-chain amino acid transport system permease protein